jgi:hypothetical protein
VAVLGTRTRALSGAAFGVLLAGSVLSFLIGFIILPLTFIGLFFIIGVLGFVPFLTAFVYFRNAVRCLRQRDARDSRPLFIGTMLLGAILVTSIPAIAQWEIRQVALDSAEQLLHSDSPSIEGAVQRLKYLSWFVDTDVIVRAYEHERDPIRKERLSRAYKEITGDDIEDRLTILND